MTPKEDITNEELQKGASVAAAGAEAAQSEPDPALRRQAAADAAQRQARKVQIELSDDDAQKVADVIIQELDLRGAFQAAPEPVQAPPAEQPSADTVQTPPDAQQPRKQSFAERFRTK